MGEPDPNDNASYGVSGGCYRPDTRTDREKRAWRRKLLISRWVWRIRGLLPRGWKDED
jgi:hypothetical protein